MKIRKMCILVSAATTNGYKTIPSFGPHPRRDLSHMYLSPSYSQSNSYQITPFHSLGCSDQVLPYNRVSLHNYFSHSLITLLLVLLCILFSLTFFLLHISSIFGGYGIVVKKAKRPGQRRGQPPPDHGTVQKKTETGKNKTEKEP